MNRRRHDDHLPITRAARWLRDNPHAVAIAIIFIIACWGLRQAAAGA